ncbi:hypothetical protein PACTADRAFT_2351 [Pachysolen tannophilus NRRL Y-2460]|uniref:DH domain-containing protein n=1 Tax=Pachysolen tannophilus NRRL Y-2460 TaxID=669874 RepID=A0A1E4TWD8_PACTA|nr:hypothetical protein PACTADRAFT_2351 [Pachysolen tannophilus NRRL Y-2460]
MHSHTSFSTSSSNYDNQKYSSATSPSSIETNNFFFENPYSVSNSLFPLQEIPQLQIYEESASLNLTRKEVVSVPHHAYAHFEKMKAVKPLGNQNEILNELLDEEQEEELIMPSLEEENKENRPFNLTNPYATSLWYTTRGNIGDSEINQINQRAKAKEVLKEVCVPDNMFEEDRTSSLLIKKTVLDLIVFEKNYLNKMLLVSDYKAVLSKKTISKSQEAILFNSFITLKDISKNFLEDLTKFLILSNKNLSFHKYDEAKNINQLDLIEIIDNCDTGKLKLENLLEMHLINLSISLKSYYMNYERQLAIFKKINETNSKFKQFVNNFQKQNNGLNLLENLKLPFKLVSEYKNILNDLIVKDLDFSQVSKKLNEFNEFQILESQDIIPSNISTTTTTTTRQKSLRLFKHNSKKIGLEPDLFADFKLKFKQAKDLFKLISGNSIPKELLTYIQKNNINNAKNFKKFMECIKDENNNHNDNTYFIDNAYELYLNKLQCQQKELSLRIDFKNCSILKKLEVLLKNCEIVKTRIENYKKRVLSNNTNIKGIEILEKQLNLELPKFLKITNLVIEKILIMIFGMIMTVLKELLSPSSKDTDYARIINNYLYQKEQTRFLIINGCRNKEKILKYYYNSFNAEKDIIPSSPSSSYVIRKLFL